MRGNFDQCLKQVLRHEGKYVNHPSDPGGRTNLGVTQRVYEDWVGYPVNEAVMRKLTVAHVKTLYKVKYWDVVKGDDLPLGLDLCVFDFGVNAGPNRAARYLQKMVGAATDGEIGPHTLSLTKQFVRERGKVAGILVYQDMRREYYKMLNTFPTFGRGWLNRVRDIEMAGVVMAKAQPDVV